MGLGILRYRLYDIDRLISRTLSYTVVTGLLIGVYVGIVVLTTDVLSFSSPVAVTASTLAAAALFSPIRNAAQRFIDRRFNRASYDAELTVAAFSARLRDAVDLDTIRADLLAVVGRAVEPTHAAIWISPARATRADSP
jgi:small basic protein